MQGLYFMGYFIGLLKMQIFRQVNQLRLFLEKAKSEKQTVGFVPTMGALHAGHLSLIERAKLENDIVVCSIFVNPTQFNDKRDLENYPRPIQADIELLKKSGCTILFNPEVEEVFPDYENDQISQAASTTYDRTKEAEELFCQGKNKSIQEGEGLQVIFSALDKLELNGID